MNVDLEQKSDYLKSLIAGLESAAVAFSAGVDSSFLLKTAHGVLGDRCAAFTVSSCLTPEREIREASEFCRGYGIRHFIIESDPLKICGFAENPPDRCYICKSALFRLIISEAEKEDFRFVLEGSNADDSADYRPGFRAVRELGVKSPLIDAGFSKIEIRMLSQIAGLDSGRKPSMACLASRIPYGEMITLKKLSMASEAEDFLAECGFAGCRVRVHGGHLARIELLEENIAMLADSGLRKRISDEFKKMGFLYVSLDIDGYRTGSLNEALFLKK